MRFCVSCDAYREDELFFEANRNQCRPCRKEYSRIYYQRNRDYAIAQTRLKLYGVTVEDVARMREDQQGTCAICKQPFRDTKDTHVDHDHVNNKARALLCRGCNQMLGNAKENEATLANAILYLRRFAAA